MYHEKTFVPVPRFVPGSGTAEDSVAEGEMEFDFDPENENLLRRVSSEGFSITSGASSPDGVLSATELFFMEQLKGALTTPPSSAPMSAVPPQNFTVMQAVNNNAEEDDEENIEDDIEDDDDGDVEQDEDDPMQEEHEGSSFKDMRRRTMKQPRAAWEGDEESIFSPRSTPKGSKYESKNSFPFRKSIESAGDEKDPMDPDALTRKLEDVNKKDGDGEGEVEVEGDDQDERCAYPPVVFLPMPMPMPPFMYMPPPSCPAPVPPGCRQPPPQMCYPQIQNPCSRPKNPCANNGSSSSNVPDILVRSGPALLRIRTNDGEAVAEYGNQNQAGRGPCPRNWNPRDNNSCGDQMQQLPHHPCQPRNKDPDPCPCPPPPCGKDENNNDNSYIQAQLVSCVQQNPCCSPSPCYTVCQPATTICYPPPCHRTCYQSAPIPLARQGMSLASSGWCKQRWRMSDCNKCRVMQYCCSIMNRNMQPPGQGCCDCGPTPVNCCSFEAQIAEQLTRQSEIKMKRQENYKSEYSDKFTSHWENGRIREDERCQNNIGTQGQSRRAPACAPTFQDGDVTITMGGGAVQWLPTCTEDVWKERTPRQPSATPPCPPSPPEKECGPRSSNQNPCTSPKKPSCPKEFYPPNPCHIPRKPPCGNSGNSSGNVPDILVRSGAALLRIRTNDGEAENGNQVGQGRNSQCPGTCRGPYDDTNDDEWLADECGRRIWCPKKKDNVVPRKCTIELSLDTPDKDDCKNTKGDADSKAPKSETKQEKTQTGPEPNKSKPKPKPPFNFWEMFSSGGQWLPYGEGGAMMWCPYGGMGMANQRKSRDEDDPKKYIEFSLDYPDNCKNNNKRDADSKMARDFKPAETKMKEVTTGTDPQNFDMPNDRERLGGGRNLTCQCQPDNRGNERGRNDYYQGSSGRNRNPYNDTDCDMANDGEWIPDGEGGAIWCPYSGGAGMGNQNQSQRKEQQMKDDLVISKKYIELSLNFNDNGKDSCKIKEGDSGSKKPKESPSSVKSKDSKPKLEKTEPKSKSKTKLKATSSKRKVGKKEKSPGKVKSSPSKGPKPVKSTSKTKARPVSPKGKGGKGGKGKGKTPPASPKTPPRTPPKKR